MVTDRRGLPLAVAVTAGQRHESTMLEPLLDSIRIPQPRGRPRQRPRRVAGDKGYDFRRIRQWLRRRRITPVIPSRSGQHTGQRPQRGFDHDAYRQRNAVERCIGWLKHCRRVGTRYEKLALNYLAIVKLALIRRYLNIAFSDTT